MINDSALSATADAIAAAVGLRAIRTPTPHRKLWPTAAAIVVLLGLRFETQVYFEAALVIAMLGFIGTVVTARFVSRGDLIDHD